MLLVQVLIQDLYASYSSNHVFLESLNLYFSCFVFYDINIFSILF